MYEFDVIVCGAGCAGFAAAIAVARGGAKTALVEKYNTPGGILTVLGDNSIDQFNNPFIPDKKMVIGGIGWEYVMRLYKDGFAAISDMDAPYENHWQYGVRVNPVAAAKVMDDMLTECGVKLFYGQPLVDAQTEENRIESILISTKSGLERLRAKIYIDCTGDGDLAAFSGAEFIAGSEKGEFQPGTLRYYPALDFKAAEKINYGDNQNHVPFDTTDSDDITRAEIESRKMIYEQMKKGEEIMAVAPGVAPREGRRIKGVSEINADDYIAGVIFEDSVCYSYWFVDIHRDGEPAIIKYIKHDKTPTIRLSAMVSKDFSNLMMAGRCISADRAANSALRVKASCMAMGQAAGCGAAIAAKSGTDAWSIDADAVKKALSDSGAIVPGENTTVSFADFMKL